MKKALIPLFVLMFSVFVLAAAEFTVDELLTPPSEAKFDAVFTIKIEVNNEGSSDGNVSVRTTRSGLGLEAGEVEETREIVAGASSVFEWELEMSNCETTEFNIIITSSANNPEDFEYDIEFIGLCPGFEDDVYQPVAETNIAEAEAEGTELAALLADLTKYGIDAGDDYLSYVAMADNSLTTARNNYDNANYLAALGVADRAAVQYRLAQARVPSITVISSSDQSYTSGDLVTTRTIDTLEVNYLIGTDFNQTTFSLKVKNTGLDQLENVKVRETIPKTVASNVSELGFSVQPTVIEADPVVEWSVGTLNAGSEQTFEYWVLLDLDDTATASFQSPEVSGDVVPTCSTITCDDANDCTVDTCDINTVTCTFTALGDGTICGDASACFDGACLDSSAQVNGSVGLPTDGNASTTSTTDTNTTGTTDQDTSQQSEDPLSELPILPIAGVVLLLILLGVGAFLKAKSKGIIEVTKSGPSMGDVKKVGPPTGPTTPEQGSTSPGPPQPPSAQQIAQQDYDRQRPKTQPSAQNLPSPYDMVKRQQSESSQDQADDKSPASNLPDPTKIKKPDWVKD